MDLPSLVKLKSFFCSDNYKEKVRKAIETFSKEKKKPKPNISAMEKALNTISAHPEYAAGFLQGTHIPALKQILENLKKRCKVFK